MDSAPAIIGTALGGAFNATEQRYNAYNRYFKKLRKEYVRKLNLLKALVSGIDTVETKLKKEITNILSKDTKIAYIRRHKYTKEDVIKIEKEIEHLKKCV